MPAGAAPGPTPGPRADAAPSRPRRRGPRSTFTLRFHQLAYVLVTVAGIPLFSTGVLSAWLALPALGVVALGYAADAGHVRRPIDRRFWIPLTVGFVSLQGLRALAEDTRFDAFLQLLLYLQAYRLLHPKRNREYLQVYVLAFFQLLVTTALTPNFSLAPIFFVFMIASTWALMALQVKRGLEEEESFVRGQAASDLVLGAATPADDLVRPRTLALTAAVALGTFLATFPIFYAIPRLGQGFFQSPLVRTQQLTGFSEEVNLGAVGEIERNRQLAMRIDFLRPDDFARLPAVRHLRGVALNHYDGNGWRKSGLDESKIARDQRFRTHSSFFTGDRRPPPDELIVEYDVYQEPIGTATLFGFERPYNFAFRGKVGHLRKDTAGSVSLPRPLSSTVRYTVSTDLSAPDPGQLQAAGDDYPEAIRDLYLGLPPDLDPRVGALARRLTAGAATPYEKLRAIERHLETEYTYTLDLVRDERLMPLEDFLFEQRRGHCEYFATAMAILAREAGIPTRVVNGFLGGTWNDVGDYLVVRQSDAHSWVEAYFPGGTGWATFDPSPRSMDVSLSESGTWNRAGRYLDAMRMSWNRYVVSFTADDQRYALGKIQQFYRFHRPGGPNPLRWMSRFGKARSLREKAAVGLAVALVAWAVWNLFTSRRARSWRRRRLDRPDDHEAIARGFYGEMLELLGRRGVRKDPATTPREFRDEVAHLHAASAGPVRTVTDVFEEVRYAGRDLEREDLDAVQSALQELRRPADRAGPDAPPPGRTAAG